MESIAAVCHEAVKRAPSGLSAEAVADLIGVRYKTLMSDLSRHDGHKPDMDLLPHIISATGIAAGRADDMRQQIISATGSDAPLRALARECGCLFVRVPEAAECAHPLTLQLVDTVKEFGDLMSTMGEALADGRIEQAEARRIARDGHDVMAAVVAVIRLAERAADTEEGNDKSD